MPYFFVLGKNSALSVAELDAVWSLKEPRLLADDFLVADGAWEIEAGALMKRLGGTIKIGRILASASLNDEQKIFDLIKEHLLNKERISGREFSSPALNFSHGISRPAGPEASGSGKFNFGFSLYGRGELDVKKIGLRLKKELSALGINSRLVVSREKALSSVVVEQNKLLRRGTEIVLAFDGQQIIIGETLAVQPFKDLSRRDYGRPARDDRSGMLPPKLALIMLNLSQVNDFEAPLADPFCGSGTILSEALLQGYKNLFASDISPEAIKNTKQNIAWIKELYKLSDFRLKIFLGRAEKLTKIIKPASLAAIVTEPYLGPQRGRLDFAGVISGLEELYGLALQEFKQALVSGGRVVMVWPSFYGQRPINPDYSGFKIINPIPEELRKNNFIKFTQRGTIIYGRSGQKVFREIVILEKI